MPRFATLLILLTAAMSRVSAQATSGSITGDRKSTRLNSSHSQISYAVFCLKKKTAEHQPAAAVVFTELCEVRLAGYAAGKLFLMNNLPGPLPTARVHPIHALCNLRTAPCMY